MRLKKILFFIFVVSSLVFSACNYRDSASFEAMNTFMTMSCYGKKARSANFAARETILAIENSISVTKEQSDVFKLNSSLCVPEFRKDAFEILDFSLKMCAETEGAFNIALYPVISAWGFTSGVYRVPSDNEISALLKFSDFSKIKADGLNVCLQDGMKVDFGAVGKGFACDKAVEEFKRFGIKSAIMDFGGNVQVLGLKPDGSLWKVGIKNPYGGSPVALVKVSDCAVVSSGGYERFFEKDGKVYIHIFDGNTGRPVENEMLSSTIICRSGARADALSTAVFVMGAERAFDFWRKNKDFEMILICKDYKLYYTKGLSDIFSVLHEGFDVECIDF